MRDYHLSFHALRKVKTNRPCASQICIGVIIFLSIKTQSLCDVLIGRELNEITPTANGRLDILLQSLGHWISGDFLIFCGRPNLDSRCLLQVFLRSLRRVSRKKKIGVNWNPQQEKYAYKNKRWRKNMLNSAFPRTLLCYSLIVKYHIQT